MKASKQVKRYCDKNKVKLNFLDLQYWISVWYLFNKKIFKSGECSITNISVEKTKQNMYKPVKNIFLYTG